MPIQTYLSMTPVVSTFLLLPGQTPPFFRKVSPLQVNTLTGQVSGMNEGVSVISSRKVFPFLVFFFLMRFS